MWLLGILYLFLQPKKLALLFPASTCSIIKRELLTLYKGQSLRMQENIFLIEDESQRYTNYMSCLDL